MNNDSQDRPAGPGPESPTHDDEHEQDYDSSEASSRFSDDGNVEDDASGSAEGGEDGDDDEEEHSDSSGSDAPPGPAEREREEERRRRRRRRRPADERKNRGLVKKLAFLTDLLACLDSLVFMELGAFYLLECSLWRFCLRSLLHYVFLTPKSASFPFLIPAAQTHIVSIIVPNGLCFLLHLFGNLPRGTRESHRGYLHGGVLADFVGQKPPTSRIPLLLLDCFVLLLQWLMLAVHSDREKVRGSMRTFVPLGGSGASEGGGTGRSSAFRIAVAGDLIARSGMADLPASSTMAVQDAAERGEAAGQASEDGGHESRESEGETDTDGAEGDDGAEDGSDDGLLGDAGRQTAEETADALLLDVLSSGLGILGHYDLIHTLRTATTNFESAAAHSLRTLSYTANLTALAAQRGSLPLEPPRPGNT